MPYLKYQRPLDPLVAQNQFRQQTPAEQPIPTFAEAKPTLPVPIIEAHPTWVEMYWRAWEMVWQSLRRPKSGSGFIANYIDSGAKSHLYMWNSALMTQFGLYGRSAFDFMSTLNNLYAKQHDDGFICREIDINEGHDFFHPFDPNSTGPNILAWVEWRYFRLTGDDSRLKWVFAPLMAFHRWCRTNRTWPDGMYWATGLSSGLSNQPRVPKGKHHHCHWSWVDATMQAALNCLTLGKIATLLEENEAATELSEEHNQLLTLINNRMWHEAEGFYQDVDVNGRFSPIKSIAAYWGLLDKEMIPEKRLFPFIKHLHETSSFKLPHRLPSQAANNQGYDAAGNEWRGAVWSATNFMVLKGLRVAGQEALAHDIAYNHIHNISTVYQHTDTFWEYYAPEATAPGHKAQSNLIGWTALSPITILLEDVLGIQADWPQRRVIWDRRLDTSQTYGVRNYPLGNEGFLELLGNQEQITITTDVPFTLILQDKTENIQAAIPTGTTEIDLN